MTSRSPYRTVGYFVLTSFLFGSSFVAIKVGVTYIPPLLFAAFRFVIGGGLLLGIISWTRDEWLPRSRGDLLAIAATGVFIIAIQNAALNVGIQYIPSSTAAIFFGLIPLLTAGLVQMSVPETSLSPSDVLGICLGFVGVLLIVRPGVYTSFTGDMKGYVLVFVAVSSIAVGSILLDRTSSHLDMLPVSAWGMVVGGVTTYIVGIAVGESVAAIEWTTASILSLVYLATVVTIVGYTVYFHLITNVGAHKANLLSYLDPVMATLVAWVVLGETIAPPAVVGFLVIFVGFVVLEHRTLRVELRTITER